MPSNVSTQHAVTARVVRHRRLSAAIAQRFLRRLPRHVHPDDVYAAADFGLVCAAIRFDTGYGVPFGAYARLRIAGSVRDELRRFGVTPLDGEAGVAVWPVAGDGWLTGVPDQHALTSGWVRPVDDLVVSHERLRFVTVALMLLPAPLARVLPRGETALPLRELALRDGVSVATMSRRRMQAKNWLKTAVAFYDGQVVVSCPPEVGRYLRQVTVRAGMLR